MGRWPGVREALRGATADAFWAVRERAVTVLATADPAMGADTVRTLAALLPFYRERFEKDDS